ETTVDTELCALCVLSGWFLKGLSMLVLLLLTIGAANEEWTSHNRVLGDVCWPGDCHSGCPACHRPSKTSGSQDATTSLVQSMFALVSSLMLIRSYIYSRTTIKAAALANAKPTGWTVGSIKASANALVAVAIALGSIGVASAAEVRGACG